MTDLRQLSVRDCLAVFTLVAVVLFFGWQLLQLAWMLLQLVLISIF